MNRLSIIQGAEAIIVDKETTIVKERVRKSYRHPSLDEELRRQRNKREASVLKKLYEKGVPVPKVIHASEYAIDMEKINGKTLTELLEDENDQIALFEDAGALVGKIHSLGVVHGDLTPSNFIHSNKLFVIDFGLSFHSLKAEDRATDLHVLEEALEAKTPARWEKLWQAVLKGYAREMMAADFKQVKARLAKIGLRGRYKAKKK